MGTERWLSRLLCTTQRQLREHGYETGLRSTIEIPATRHCRDLSFCPTDLDLVRRSDQQAHVRALAGMAAVETGSPGLDSGWSALGALQGRSGTLGSRCGGAGCIRRSA